MCSGHRCRIRRVLGYKGRSEVVEQKCQENDSPSLREQSRTLLTALGTSTFPELGILALCSSQQRDTLSMLVSSASPLRPHNAILCSCHSCPRLPLKIPPRYPNIQISVTIWLVFYRLLPAVEHPVSRQQPKPGIDVLISSISLKSNSFLRIRCQILFPD